MHWWIGQVGPRGAEWGRVGQCEQGRLVLSALRLGPGYKDRPSGAALGRVGSSRAE